MHQSYLATDLDGTWLPLSQEDLRQLSEASLQADEIESLAASQHSSLATLSNAFNAGKFGLVYVTGRHAQSVMQCIDEFRIPKPEYIICDVGTTMLKRVALSDGEIVYERVDGFSDEITGWVQGQTAEGLPKFEREVDSIRLQEPEKQGLFKRSYYAKANEILGIQQWFGRELVARGLPYQVITSVDPFNGDGLIDLVPTGVSKSTAITWWAEHVGLSIDQVIYAGDSGNDYAPLVMGVRAIVVGNADRGLAQSILEHHRQAETEDQLFLATMPCTSGVLEGLKKFGVL